MARKKTKETKMDNSNEFMDAMAGGEELVSENVETTAADAASTEPAAPAEPKTDKRHKMISVPVAEGEEPRLVKRTDYIRELWATGNHDRSSIRDHINKECTSDDESHVIAYQIVNAAVKDQAGGPSAEFVANKAARKEAAKAAKAAEKAAEKADAAAPVEGAGEVAPEEVEGGDAE